MRGGEKYAQSTSYVVAHKSCPLSQLPQKFPSDSEMSFIYPRVPVSSVQIYYSNGVVVPTAIATLASLFVQPKRSRIYAQNSAKRYTYLVLTSFFPTVLLFTYMRKQGQVRSVLLYNTTQPKGEVCVVSSRCFYVKLSRLTRLMLSGKAIMLRSSVAENG